MESILNHGTRISWIQANGPRFWKIFTALYFHPTIYNGGYTSDKPLTKLDRQMGEKKPTVPRISANIIVKSYRSKSVGSNHRLQPVQ